MITEKLTEILGGLFEAIGEDLGLYVGLGLTLVVFLAGLIVSLVSSGELKKFKSCASAALKDGAASVNANMQKMPIRVKKLYKRAMLTGAKPSDVINVDAAVGTPFAKSGMAKFPAVTAVGTVVAICAGVGLSMVNSLIFGATEGIIIAASGLLGGLLMLIANIISSLSYKGALKTYEDLMEELDSLARGGKTEQPHEEESETQSYGYAGGAAQESEPQTEYEQPRFEEPTQTYEEPTYAQQAYEQEAPDSEPAQATVVVEEQSAEDIAAERARAREEAMAAARAEQAAAQAAAQSAQAEQTKTAAQQRLDELKAQREAQLKAQREAMAQQRAAQAAQSAQAPSVSAEDVIERIDKIESRGASLSEMREVAMLLQKERAKPENKSAEQQKRLNEALSKLLKAMSAAQKK